MPVCCRAVLETVYLCTLSQIIVFRMKLFVHSCLLLLLCLCSSSGYLMLLLMLPFVIYILLRLKQALTIFSLSICFFYVGGFLLITLNLQIK